MTDFDEEPHPICKQLRDLRHTQRWSLPEAAGQLGVNTLRLGSYERGERNPPLAVLEQIFNGYGYTVVAIPKDFDAVRLTGSIVRELRDIADQLEARDKSDVQIL